MITLRHNQPPCALRQVPMFEKCDDAFIKALVQLLKPSKSVGRHLYEMARGVINKDSGLSDSQVLQAASYKLQVASYKLQAASHA